MQLPKSGRVQLIIRVTGADRNKINRAAEIVKLKQSQFLRRVLIPTAEAIIEREKKRASKSRAARRN